MIQDAFPQAIRELNEGFGEGANVTFVPLGLRDAEVSLTDRAQRQINKEIDRCQVFILALFRRWGQYAPDAAPYSSYTEEEFHYAFKRCRNSCCPRILFFYKKADVHSEADPGPHLKTVMGFRDLVKPYVLPQLFTTGRDFQTQVKRVLIAHAKGSLAAVVPPTTEIPPTKCWVRRPGTTKRNPCRFNATEIATNIVLRRNPEVIEERMRQLTKQEEYSVVEWYLYSLRELGLQLMESYDNADMLDTMATISERRGETDRRNILQTMAAQMRQSLDNSGRM